MKTYIKYMIILMAALAMTSEASASESAASVLNRAASAVNSSNGLTAAFTLDYGGQKVSGSIKALGNKFVMETSATSTWYDGKSMWTYNPKTSETTLTIPTASEVAEANPLSLVNTYSSSFTASFTKTQKAGSKTIVLTPKSKSLGYKSVHVTISDTTSLPTQIVVVPLSGQKITVSISKVNKGVKMPDATFVYPKGKYPKVEIVDLR